jgi:tetratricopeptide (TPR) repeat protein
MTLVTLGSWLFKIGMALCLTSLYLKWFAKRQARDADAALDRVKANIKSGDLVKAQRAFDAMKRYKGTERGRIVYAVAAFNLVDAYKEKGQVVQAQAVFDVVNRLRKSAAVQMRQAAAADSMVEAYCKTENLAKAQGIFNAMRNFGSSETIRCLQTWSANYLIRAYGKVGNLEAAQAAFDAMPDIGTSDKVRVAQAHASLDLAYHYGTKGALDKARALFDATNDVKTTDAVFAARRAMVSSALVFCYCNTENLNEAQKIFDAMQALGKSEQILLACAETATCLIQFYGKVGNLVKAQAVFDAMPPWAASRELRLIRAEASATMVYAYGVIGQRVQRGPEPGNEPDVPKAQAIFDAMQTLGNTPDIIQFRAEASLWLVVAYGRLGKDVARARACFDSLADFSDTDKIRLLRARASVAMIEAYGCKGRLNAWIALDTIPISAYGEDEPLSKSRAIYEAMPALGDSEAFRVLRAEAASNLIADYCNIGQLDEASALCETIKNMGQSAEIQAALAFSLLRLSRAYAISQNIAQARETFLALKALPATEKVREYRDMAAHGLITDYHRRNNADEVCWMLDAIADLGDSSVLQVARRWGALDLEKSQQADTLKNQGHS